MSAHVPRVLIIAGSDSSGGAGIQADLKTVSALGAFGMTAITALTAQNTTGVYGSVEMEPEFIAQQIGVCVNDVGCDAVKTGMLSSVRIIETVASELRERALRPVVVDPVMIAKSGAPLLRPDAVDALRTRLLPLASVLTPNLHEAAALVGRPLESLEQIQDAARAIQAMGPQHVVVKAGSLPHIAADILFDGGRLTVLAAERLETRHTHGSGCIFASAIAALLAGGRSVHESVVAAREFTRAAIRGALPIGQGRGPANPMAFVGECGPGIFRDSSR